MIRSLYQALIAGAALGLAIPALATPCYAIIDRNDVVVFRNTNTPVDLSNAGAPAREAMRSRGELLVFFDSENCVVIGRAASTGGRPATTEEIVSGWRSTGKGGFGGTYGSTVAADLGGGIAAPMPTNVGPTPAAVANRPIDVMLR